MFIRKLGDPILRNLCSPVENTAAVGQIFDEMLTLLRAIRNGAAIAAPQVGIAKRLVVIKQAQPLELINPYIVTQRGKQTSPETCLSIPGIVGNVTRFRYVTVKALNRSGEEITIMAKGFLARCLQHEIDHLDGVLFIDHVPPGQLRDQATKKSLDVTNLIEFSKEGINNYT